MGLENLVDKFISRDTVKNVACKIAEKDVKVTMYYVNISL